MIFLLKRLKDYIKRRGFFISITRPWPGEGKLSDKPMDREHTVTKDEVNAEIQESLHKKGG